MIRTPNPTVIPSICGIVRPKPKFAAEAVTMTTFGPGVSDMTAAKRSKGPSDSGMRRRCTPADLAATTWAVLVTDAPAESTPWQVGVPSSHAPLFAIIRTAGFAGHGSHQRQDSC